jgi:very-short-patch-repair endonuclease
MHPKDFAIGQKATSKKEARAKKLRREMTEEGQILWRHLRTNRLGGWQRSITRLFRNDQDR